MRIGVAILFLVACLSSTAYAECTLPGPDTDGDGISDLCDLCPMVPDPGQIDSDFDSLGDACDPCPLNVVNIVPCLMPPPCTDTDADGLCDDLDNCPLDPNSGQEDLDSDKIGDDCDGDVDGDGATPAGGDCDDLDRTRFPLAYDSCQDGIDQDCSGADATCGSGPNAPPRDKTVPTPFHRNVEFLYTGAQPVQTGVSAGAIKDYSVSVIRGVVKEQNGDPLSGVTITIVRHPELGQTATRADGQFDIAVNGGGPLVVNYEKNGFLPVQRSVQPRWNNFAIAGDVVMRPLDPVVTTVDVDGTGAFQVAAGSTVTDSDGTRQAVLMFPANVTAELVFADGTTLAQSSLDIRATEYTVGTNGPASMPADLPPFSKYTYAVELSSDEGWTLGAPHVQFSEPVPFYVENFLDYPVGDPVPAGYYDRERGTWVPMDNGVILQITSITGGLADLDTTGDGVAESNAALADLGISSDEQTELALRYSVGQSLWRVALPHFSTVDLNWPGAQDFYPLPPAPDSDNQSETDGSEGCGSVIDFHNQTLGESVPVVGTPYRLHYQSDRTADYGKRLKFPISGSVMNPECLEIDVRIEIAGRVVTQTYPALANQTVTYEWDGLDAYGRPVQGHTAARITVDHVYPSWAPRPAPGRAFGQPGTDPRVGQVQAREPALRGRTFEVTVGSLNAATTGLGGFSLSPHHTYQPRYNELAPVLLRGDGRRIRRDMLRAELEVIAGQIGVQGYSGDNSQATNARIDYISGIAVGPDGSIYLADNEEYRIRKISPDGIITTIGGTGVEGASGNGGPALSATMAPWDLALGPDGSIYFTDTEDGTVRRIDPQGIVDRFAGTGIGGYNGDEIPAVDAQLYGPLGLAVAPDGTVYVADRVNRRVRSITPDGIIHTVAGTGVSGTSGDGDPAKDATLIRPWDVALGSDGSLYIGDAWANTIRKVDTDGIITRIAGNGTYGTGGDGGPALDAQLGVSSLAVGLDGTIYVTHYASSSGHTGRVRSISPRGIINTVAGGGTVFRQDRPSPRVSLQIPAALAVAPDGDLIISDTSYTRAIVVRTSPVTQGAMLGDALVASEDSRLVYVFDADNRHSLTLDAVTGVTVNAFRYDGQGFLTVVEDANGRVTRILRDGNGAPTAIVAPDGQTTTIGLNANGLIHTITNPASQSYTFAYHGTGALLATMTDPNGGEYAFTYDAGRLSQDDDAADGFTALSRTTSTNSYSMSVVTAEAVSTTYSVDTTQESRKEIENTFAFGGVATMTRADTGVTTVTPASGMQHTSTVDADSRFGLEAPVTISASTVTPGGLARSITRTREVTLSNPSDPLSLQSYAETRSVNGKTWRTEYDPPTRTRTTTTPEGRTSTVTSDARGRPIEVVSGTMAPTQLSYDPMGRLIKRVQGTSLTDQRVTNVGYDAQGRLAQITDAMSRTTTFEYDAADRLTKTTLPGGAEIQLGYDGKGNTTSVTPPGKPAHAMDYTPVNLLETYDPPAAGFTPDLTTYSYNKDRKLTSEARPDGQTVSYGYNAAGQNTTLTYSAGTRVHTYDGTTGKLEVFTQPNGDTLTLTYDGDLLTQQAWAGNINGAVQFTYDNFFRRATRTVGSSTIMYGYDDDSLLTQAGSLALTRDAQNGWVTQNQLGDTTETFSYNAFGELEAHEVLFQGVVRYSARYTRDKLGRITSVTEAFGDPLAIPPPVSRTREYDYDTAGRLVLVVENGVPAAQYTYDQNGNRLTKWAPTGGTVSATYDDQDRLLTYGSLVYTYTENGELETKTDTSTGDVTTYLYDTLGNLVRVDLPNGDVVEYVVDGKNRRVGKRVNGVLTQAFLYENKLRVAAELDGAGNVLALFVYSESPNSPDYAVKGGNTYRITKDQVGSPRLVVDSATGSVAQRMDYDEFGVVTSEVPAGFQPFGFAGGLYDRDTALVRFGARDYDAMTGRWTAKDPLRFGGGDTSLYAYALGDPINNRDPSGNFAQILVPILWAFVAVLEAELLNAAVGSAIALAIIAAHASILDLINMAAAEEEEDVEEVTDDQIISEEPVTTCSTEAQPNSPMQVPMTPPNPRCVALANLAAVVCSAALVFPPGFCHALHATLLLACG
ncbi:MAG: RHS repeat-associated core domain-containing protein [Myxococcota bacterium]